MLKLWHLRGFAQRGNRMEARVCFGGPERCKMLCFIKTIQPNYVVFLFVHSSIVSNSSACVIYRCSNTSPGSEFLFIMLGPCSCWYNWRCLFYEGLIHSFFLQGQKFFSCLIWNNYITFEVIFIPAEDKHKNF